MLSEVVAVVQDPPEQSTRPSLSDLLAQVIEEYQRGNVCHRRHLLRSGQAADAYILAARAQGQQRDQAVRTIAARLAEIERRPVQSSQVNRLIGTYHVARLLAADVAIEDIPHRILREFIALLKRNTATDAWTLRPGLESQAQELFDEAIAKRWDVAAVVDAVRELRGKRRPGDADEEGGPCGPFAHLKEAAPDDVGEMLAKIIGDHADPRAVVESLATHLDWSPSFATVIALAILRARAYRSANAMMLAFRHAEREGGLR